MINLRLANERDCQRYLDWRNDPVVRESAFESSPIEFKTHKVWFLGKLESPESILYVVELDNSAIGQVRFEIDDEVAEVNYSIDENYRGKRLASSMMSCAIEKLLMKNRNVKSVVAKVKQGNLPSMKVFENLSFTKKDCKNQEDYSVFELQTNF
ncbi:GNAT family N-acetyltransferase [Aliikangiella sp. G2MR2-5]|uniref:GNAT family N-acetyltransferase n=1 Tax=Aliikangiella sp. G2MR2-5 TaxID=2788943 RepID=UPI0018AC5B14|nr:GNAT family N-acetyltransferase [Aliikangiella sp. G2MR2-5]